MKIKLLFKGFKEGFQEFGHLISTIVNSVLLFIVFTLGIGLVSVYAKLKNKKFLDMKPNIKDSYWTDKINRNKTQEDSLKPF